nr:hypothetical protein GCM10020093_104390 [Planobispora longispora]
MERQAAGFAGGSLEVAVHIEGGLPGLPAAVEVAAYRIIAEALANVSRHARATTCAVRLAAVRGALEAEVTDDGRGLPPDPSPASASSRCASAPRNSAGAARWRLAPTGAPGSTRSSRTEPSRTAGARFPTVRFRARDDVQTTRRERRPRARYPDDPSGPEPARFAPKEIRWHPIPPPRRAVSCLPASSWRTTTRSTATGCA